MIPNSNLVKKSRQEVEMEEYENNANENLAKKRMVKFMAIIVAILIVLLLCLFFISMLFKKKYDYEDLENILEKAAISYFGDNKNLLPEDDGDSVDVDSTTLISNGYMKDFTEYLKEDIVCTGGVSVEKSADDYLYIPYLNCGEDYETKSFSKKILELERVVTSGYGLYSNNGSYIFRGEEVNNYVELDNGLWRIVRINSNDSVVLISNDGLQFSNTWDDRYNSQAEYSGAGINQYNTSRVKEYLEKIYKGLVKDEELLTQNDKAKLISFNMCTAKRNKNAEGTNNIECSEVLRNQKIGLLTASEYLSASVDPNCKSIETKSCSNYNYLVNMPVRTEWWLGTASDEDTTQVYQVSTDGIINTDNASSYASIRPIVYLNSKVMYKSGTGSINDPYKIK